MVDSKDKKILAILRNDARMPLSSIASMTGIPLSTVFDRFRRLEQTSILKHTTLIDFESAGHPFTVNFWIEVDDERAFLGYVMPSPHINTLTRVSSGYLAECIFRNMSDLHAFTLDLKKNGAKRIDEHHVIERIKHEAFFCG